MVLGASQVAQWERIHWQGGTLWFNPWVEKIPWRRKWQPNPVFLPGKSHGQRSLEGYSPWCCRVRYDWATKQQQKLNVLELFVQGLDVQMLTFMKYGTVSKWWPVWTGSLLGMRSELIFSWHQKCAIHTFSFVTLITYNNSRF